MLLVDLEEKTSISESFKDLNSNGDETRKLFETALNKLKENENIVETILKQSHKLNNEIDELIEV